MSVDQKEGIKVWDPLIRVFHWSLVFVFAIAYITGEDESDIHAYAGYVIAGLIGFRVLWGFVGSAHARFADFIYSPKTIMEYLGSLFGGEPKHYTGHNPAGGIMVVIMLVTLFIVTWTGLKAYGAEGHGPLAEGKARVEVHQISVTVLPEGLSGPYFGFLLATYVTIIFFRPGVNP